MNECFVTRFAPSPTGPLHLGHAYSALLAYDMACAAGGIFLLRFEDIDRQRSKPAWEQQIIDDLGWLGIHWDAEPMRQSDRQPAYDRALDSLWLAGLLYPCTCSRRDVEAALSAPQEGAEVTIGPDGLIYPGTCRHRMDYERTFPEHYARPRDATLRLEVSRIGPQHFQHRIDSPDGGWHSCAGYVETGFGPAGRTTTMLRQN